MPQTLISPQQTSGIMQKSFSCLTSLKFEEVLRYVNHDRSWASVWHLEVGNCPAPKTLD
jgi:hypothetical protein